MPYQQITHAELLQLLKNSWDGTPFWTDAQGTRYLNQALRLWNLLTGMWKRKVLVATPNSAGPYISLPGSLTYTTKVIWGKTGRALAQSSLSDLDAGAPRWEEETGTPTIWAPVGLTIIATYPYDTITGMPLIVDGVAATPVLSGLDSFVDMGEQDAMAVIGAALYIACFSRGVAAQQAMQPFLQQFVAAAQAQNYRLGQSSFFRKFLGMDAQRWQRPVVSVGQAAGPAPGGEGA